MTICHLEYFVNINYVLAAIEQLFLKRVARHRLGGFPVNAFMRPVDKCVILVVAELLNLEQFKHLLSLSV